MVWIRVGNVLGKTVSLPFALREGEIKDDNHDDLTK